MINFISKLGSKNNSKFHSENEVKFDKYITNRHHAPIGAV
jgi:hypothetical protein